MHLIPGALGDPAADVLVEQVDVLGPAAAGGEPGFVDHLRVPDQRAAPARRSTGRWWRWPPRSRRRSGRCCEARCWWSGCRGAARPCRAGRRRSGPGPTAVMIGSRMLMSMTWPWPPLRSRCTAPSVAAEDAAMPQMLSASPKAGSVGGPSGSPVRCGETAHRLREGAEARPRGVRPGLAEPGEPHDDQAGVDLVQLVRVRAPSARGCRAEVLDDDVGGRRQAQEQLRPFGRGQARGRRSACCG